MNDDWLTTPNKYKRYGLYVYYAINYFIISELDYLLQQAQEKQADLGDETKQYCQDLKDFFTHLTDESNSSSQTFPIPSKTLLLSFAKRDTEAEKIRLFLFSSLLFSLGSCLTFITLCSMNKIDYDFEHYPPDALAVFIEKINEPDHHMVIKTLANMIFKK